MSQSDHALHRLGWKAFQDLCIALVEERLQRPVQTFLPSNDAGRDGAFLGRWDNESSGESTIQCKFTSKADQNLVLSMLKGELPKAKRLAERGLANDYIILTNHPITGHSELRIKIAFQQAGVGRCRVFHRDWIVQRIRESPRLRMMVPRLYCLVDLTAIFDARSYKQTQLILSEMEGDLQKLVVTEAHRKSVRAITEYNLVLLLGSPAAGKSTIGASLALGAADTWNSWTIKSTSPEHLERHLEPDGQQFFWVDDAWGSTQYQRDRTERWNQVFPLIQGAMRRGTRFLMTSRDYIWREAQQELKLPALPALKKSQVIINVHELTVEEKARILYNHIKLGDQDEEFRSEVKPFLPDLANRDDFLPESARRLGTKIFTGNLPLTQRGAADFFARPKAFLEETIDSLAPSSRAAIALIFLNGGQARSPVPAAALEQPASSFGVEPAMLRLQLSALDGSLLNLAKDEEGPYWTYRHPTVGDAFASYVAKSPELIEIYLQGARAETIVCEVVCAGMNVSGAPLVVPNSMHDLLADRIGNLPSRSLSSFLSYRSSPEFTKRVIALRPDILDRLFSFFRPLSDDVDVDLLVTLHSQELLPEEHRLEFVKEVRAAVIEELDRSFLEDGGIASVLTEVERNSILDEVAVEISSKPEFYVRRLWMEWDNNYSPEDYFDDLRYSFAFFAGALGDHVDSEAVMMGVESAIQEAILDMEEEYKPPASNITPPQQSVARSDSLDELFRDVDE